MVHFLQFKWSSDKYSKVLVLRQYREYNIRGLWTSFFNLGPVLLTWYQFCSLGTCFVNLGPVLLAWYQFCKLGTSFAYLGPVLLTWDQFCLLWIKIRCLVNTMYKLERIKTKIAILLPVIHWWRYDQDEFFLHCMKPLCHMSDKMSEISTSKIRKNDRHTA